MAIYPCDYDTPHRYTGPGAIAYLNIYSGAWSNRRRVRACPLHMTQLQSYLDPKVCLVSLGDTTIEDDHDPTACRACGGMDAPYQFIASLYPRGEEVRAYASSYCQRCIGPLAQDARISL